VVGRLARWSHSPSSASATASAGKRKRLLPAGRALGASAASKAARSRVRSRQIVERSGFASAQCTVRKVRLEALELAAAEPTVARGLDLEQARTGDGA